MPVPYLWLAVLLAAGDSRDPEAFVRELLAAEAGAQGACTRLVSSTIETKTLAGDDAVLEESHTSIIGGAIERRATSHSRITLKRTAEGWQLAKRESLEHELVERLAAVAADERGRLFASAPELHTETFVRLAAVAATRLVNQRRLEDAGSMAALAVRVADRLGDPRSLAEAASAQSMTARYATPRQHELAIELARQAVDFAERAGDADTLARALVRQSRAAEDAKGSLDPAPLERALALADQLEDPSIAAHAAIHLSRFLEARGRGRDAFRHAVLAWRSAEMGEDISARISAALMLGGAYMWSSQHTIAIRYLRRAAELAETAGFVDVIAFTYAAISNAQRFLGEEEEALQTLEEGLRRFPGREGVPLLHSRMGIHITEGRYAEAERDLLRSVELEPRDATNEKQREAHFAWLRLAQGDYEAAVFHAARSRGRTVVIDHHALMMETAALRCLGRPRDAIERLDEFVEVPDQVDAVIDPQTVPFHGFSSERHELLIELLVEQGSVVRALEISELAKATQLRAALQRSDLDPGTIGGSAEQRQEQGLEERIRELNRALVGRAHAPAEVSALLEQLADARADLIDFRQRAFATRPALRARHPSELRLESLPPSLDAVTIVSYMETGTQTVIFAILPKENGRREVRVRIAPISNKDLAAKVDRLSAFIEERNLRVSQLAEELYDLLIAPVENVVRSARMLCIVPDRDLWRVPFHALAPRGGTAVIDRTPVFYASSMSVLAAAELRRQERTAERNHSLLAFANPAVAGETEARYRLFDASTVLGALPDAETEVRGIAAIYGPARSRVHIGEDARESTLKREAGRYDVLHIAAHGLVHESAPLFSSIVLAAAGEEEDGLLEVREIVGLELDTGLTVLSACDSGRSAGGRGRGVMGLSWAFLAAGCPTTAVSLWSAQSAATATLMIEFHRQLAKGLSKPAALRLAQLRLRRDARYRHMFYWAPFVIVGAP